MCVCGLQGRALLLSQLPTRPFPSVLEWEEMHFCRLYLPILLALDVGRGVTMNFWQLPSWALVSGDRWCWMVPPFKTAVLKGRSQ